ncbi:MAG TPA: S8 family peptidase, partial [Ardenticatenaceae bacterium]|nr:S8 family peptidase [Ardenticatenaceae bacterium]
NRAADASAAASGGRKLRDLAAADGFVLELPGRAVMALGRNPAVKFITLDAEMRSTERVDSSRLATLYNQSIGATGLWSTAQSSLLSGLLSGSQSSPMTGAGIGVAVLDTGITDRPDFRGPNGTSRVVANALFNSKLLKTDDGHGHGTHVAGIVAGNSWHQADLTLKGKYIGVAPEANLINVRVSDEQGKSYVSDVVDAIDWVVANRLIYNIRVMNLSLVSSVAESHLTSVLDAAVERAWFSGIFVVVASGNKGPNTMVYPPANDPFVVSVGAADTMGTVAPGDDTIAPWSSYGTTQDGFSKPDVVAPGRQIVSPLSSATATMAKSNSSRIVDGSYIWMSGTSMAAPVVAGLAALAFQAHPEWTNDQVKWLLQQTATRLGSSLAPVIGQGAGEVNAAAVVGYSGVPGFANQNLAISHWLVTSDGSTAYDSSSWSTASWSTASWSTASWSTASWSTASWSTSNDSTAVTDSASVEEIE